MVKYKIGNIIDEKYYLESILEETELVSTYKIWHGNLEASVVGKIINYQPENECKRSSLLKKAKQWVELGVHPNIISAYFLREIEDNLILILESIPNKNLLELKKRVKQNILEILVIALEIANGISYLHEKGVVHNALCLKNILIDKYGRIKIDNVCWNQWEGLEKISKGQRCDFYDKSDKSQLTDIRKKIVRKLVYQGPDYFLKKDYSPCVSSDIYSFGVMLYELIADCLPISLENDVENLYLECKTKYESNLIKYLDSESYDVPVELCNFINSCINKDSGNRPADFKEIIATLQEIYKTKSEKYYIFEKIPSNITLAMALNNRALGYIDKNKYLEAEKILRESTDLDTSNIVAPMNYHLLKLRQMKITFEEFVERITKYTLFNDIRLYLLLGKSCLESGSLTCKIFKKINNTKFFDNRLDLIKGHLNYRLQNYENARGIYKEQLKINNTQDVWYRLGASLLSLKLNEDAGKIWEQGLDKSIPIADLIIDYTMLLAMQKQWAKARNYLDTAMQNFDNYIKCQPTLSTWGQVRNLKASEKSEVIEVAISNEKKYIFANTKDGKYHFWLWPSGEKCHDIDLPSFSSSTITSYSQGFVANRNTTRILQGLLEFNIAKIKVSRQNFVGITTHGDQIVRIWDLRQGRCLHELECHSKVVTDVAISSDGKIAVSGSMDKTIRIWDTQKGVSLGSLKGHEDSITCITMTEDSKCVVSGSWDNTIRIWDLQSKDCLTVIETGKSNITALGISSNGNILVSGDKNTGINIWDIKTEKLLARLRGHQKEITCIDISQDEMLIVSSSIDGSVSVYENIAKRPCPCWSHANYFLASLPHPVSLEINQNINDLERELDENLKLQDTQIVLSNYKDLLKLKKEVIINKFPLSLLKTRGIVNFLRKNKYFRKKLLDYYKVRILIHENPVVSYSLNNNTLYSLSKKGVFKRWLLEENQSNIFWEKSFWGINGFCFSPEYKCFVFAGNDGLLKLWYPESDDWQILEGDPSPLQCIKIFNDKIITGSNNGLLQFWDIRKAELISSVKAHEQMIVDFAIIEKENILVTIGLDRKLYCWDIDSLKKVKEIQTSNINLSVDLVYGDELYFITGGIDGTIQQWSASTGLLYSVKKICNSAITFLESMKDQALILCGNKEGYLSLWDLERYNCYFSVQAHKDAITQVSFSSDGEWAFSSSQDNSLIVWKLNWEWDL